MSEVDIQESGEGECSNEEVGGPTTARLLKGLAVNAKQVNVMRMGSKRNIVSKCLNNLFAQSDRFLIKLDILFQEDR